MNIEALCRDIRELPEENLIQMELVAQQQLSYTHPLKNATAAKQNALGAYNVRVLTKLRALRAAMKNPPR